MERGHVNRPGETAESCLRSHVTLGAAFKSSVMLAVLVAVMIVARPAAARADGAKQNIVVPVTVMINLSSRPIRQRDEEVVERTGTQLARLLIPVSFEARAL